MTTKLALVPLLLSGLLIEVTAHAADHSGVMPFMADDVVAIAYLDLRSIDVPALLDEMRDLGAVPLDQWDDVARDMSRAQRWFNKLVASGATRCYVLLRTSDLQHQGPTWVLPLTDNADPNAIIQLAENQFEGSNRPAFFPDDFRVVDGAVLAAMNKPQMERLATRRAGEPREEVVAALDELGDGNAGVIVLGDADSRRVLREMFPRLFAPFQQIDGRLIADDLLWGGVTVDLPPGPKVTIHIETSRPKVAATVQHTAVMALELAKLPLSARLAAPEVRAASFLKTIGLLKPKIEGTAVKLTLGGDAEELARIRDLLTPQIAAAGETAQRNRRINQFRQLALAFANYESAHGVFVGQANYDQAGQPLLSWRVHLLPYLEQQTLYAEFHLDEPWDSPHNRKLIERMPNIYSDPAGAVRRAVGAGRTTLLAPVADETLFPPREALPEGEPLAIRDVKDGVSKTIVFIEVVPERSVVWTKPEDWNVNLAHPFEGVKRTERSGFVAAFCDAHVRYISNDIDAQKLLAMLTRAGGESVD